MINESIFIDKLRDLVILIQIKKELTERQRCEYLFAKELIFQILK